MNILILILVLLLTSVVLLTPASSKPQQGGTVMGPFQILTEQEMDGVPGTWSGKPNAKNNDIRPIMVADKNPITYYGHGIPIIPVEPGPIINPLKIAHNSGIAVRPECCPSPYSTDRGCLCGALEDLKR